MNSLTVQLVIALISSFSNASQVEEPVPPSANKLRILDIYGDSIRKGYEPYLRKDLIGEWHIWSTGVTNGLSSKEMQAWYTKSEEDKYYWYTNHTIDMMHINAGLHDAQSGKSVKEYMDNMIATVDAIDKWVNKGECFKLWIATTTTARGSIEARVREYNLALKSHEWPYEWVVVYDLWAIDKERAFKKLPDGVHYTPEGYEGLAKEISKVISGDRNIARRD